MIDYTQTDATEYTVSPALQNTMNSGCCRDRLIAQLWVQTKNSNFSIF